ncbi:MAG: Sec-independent protein translocase protein TatB [Gammaproteobacteria bacterium]|jgi:sec-independent protein translocase protein TatB
MFDVGFWELVVVGVLALLVAGPERLPGIVRTVGRWTGHAKAVLSTFKAELEREIRLDEEREAEAARNTAEREESAEPPGSEEARRLEKHAGKPGDGDHG